MKIEFNLSVAILLISFLSLTACSVEISQTQSVQGIPTHPPTSPAEAFTPTLPSLDLPSTITPTTTNPGDPILSPTLSPTPDPAFPFLAVESPSLNLQVIPGYPETLEGRTLFLSTLEDGLQALIAFDLNTGEASPLFVTPPKAWILSQSVYPSANEILIAYAPPPPEGQPSYGYTDLYILKSDGNLAPILQRTEDIEAFFGALFSPAGDYVYYSHFFADSTANSGFRYDINRVGYPTGTPEVVVEDAFWQRLSEDGSKLAYVTFDVRDYSELYVANADGTNPVRVLDPEQYPITDAPFFSPDNQYLYFSAIVDVTTPTPLTLWEKLQGVHIAQAHTVPSDFFRVSLTDGSVIRITNLQGLGMYGTFSPDGRYIAFLNGAGLYVMRPDGAELFQVLSGYGMYGSVEWIP